MAARGDTPRPEAHGLVTLVQALLGGAALLLAGLAFVFVGSGPVIPTLEDLPGVQAAGEPVAAAPASADTDDDLRVSVRGPARLVAGRPAPLDVRVGDAATGLGSGQRVLLTFDLELRREARGWVLVGPGRLLTSAADLPREAITLTGLRGIDCGTPLGTLTVTARELADHGRSGQATYQLPQVACPGDDVPEAPESLHLQQRVWDSGNGDWRAQVARLLAPAPAPTTSTASAPARAPSPTRTRDGSGSGTEDTASDDDTESRERSSGGATDTDEAPEERQTDSTKPREPADEDDAAPEKEPEADDSGTREPSPDDGDGSDTDGQRGTAGGSTKD